MKELKTTLLFLLTISIFGCIEKTKQTIAPQKSKTSLVSRSYHNVANNIGFIKHQNFNDFKIPPAPLPSIKEQQEPVVVVYPNSESINEYDLPIVEIVQETPCKCIPAPFTPIAITTIDTTSKLLVTKEPALIKLETLVYPNPTNGNATLSLNLFQAEQFEIILYNANGQFISEIHSGYLAEGKHNFRLDLSQNESGMYLINVLSISQKEVFKIVKN